MLFSQRSAARSWLFDSNNLFAKLLSLALLGHFLLVLALFLADKIGVQAVTISMKGARVTMLPGVKGAVTGNAAGLANAVQNASLSLPKESIKENKTEESLKPKELSKKSDSKKESKKEESAKEKLKQSSMSEPKKYNIADLPKAVKKEEKNGARVEEKVPEFSQLKKDFSKLSKKKIESKDQKELPAKKLRSVNDEQKNSHEVAAKIAEPIRHGVAAAGAVSQAHSGSLNSYPTGAPVETEMGEFVGEDVAGYHDEFRQELAKYLRIPPGFEQHEPINISWDVQDGVVVYVSPQGSEPLVIYAAYKDAILKCNYPRLKYRKKYVYTFA